MRTWRPIRVLQIGGVPLLDYRVSESVHYIHVDRTFEFIAQGHSVCADFSKLPFESNMFDAVICPHVHELATSDTAKIFQESARILADNGALVVFGIHTGGMWWFRNIFQRQFFTWNHRWQSAKTVRNACKKLGVTMRKTQYLYPSSKKENALIMPFKKTILSLGKKCLPSMGCGYMYVGVKESQSFNWVGAVA